MSGADHAGYVAEVLRKGGAALAKMPKKNLKDEELCMEYWIFGRRRLRVCSWLSTTWVQGNLYRQVESMMQRSGGAYYDIATIAKFRWSYYDVTYLSSPGGVQ